MRNYNNIKITFHGVNYPKAYLNNLKQKILQTANESIRFSKCEVLISKKDNKYKGVMSIKIGHKKSIAIFHGDFLEEVINKLFRITQNKIRRLTPAKFHRISLSQWGGINENS
jgi:predicted YcjX-like family ATPase